MRELLEYLARLLVDHPDNVQVEEYEEDDGTLVLERWLRELRTANDQDNSSPASSAAGLSGGAGIFRPRNTTIGRR